MNKLPYKILVVEDDPAALEFLESCFNGELSTAVSLKEAWEEMKKSMPDLIILGLEPTFVFFGAIRN